MEKYKQNSLQFKKPVLGFAAYSGTGKTTLLKNLLPLMKLQGLRVAMIKQSHHDIELDSPGKDSYELRKAGADQVLLACDQRYVLMAEHNETGDLETLVKKLDLDNIDIVLVEGFRHLPFPKIELHRPSMRKPLIFIEDESVVAVACDEPLDTAELPLLNINIVEEVAGFINRWLDNRLEKEGENNVKRCA
jgi:molybdopterin-guanine dinucleotide biosynthesis adapter protein